MNIFLAFTPYHALLAYAVAQSQKQCENILFVIAEFPEAETLSKALNNSSFEVFQNVVCLPGSHKGKNIVEKLFKRKKNALFLKKFISSYCIENVFVGNNSRIEAQAALYYAKCADSNCRGIYMEDGTAAYRSEFPAEKKVFTKFFCKLFFGLWWHDENILGVSPRIDICQVLFPEFVREELKVKKVVAIKKEDFLHIKNDRAFVEYFNSFHFSINDIQNIDVLLIGMHSDMEKKYPRLKEVMNVILTYIENKKLRFVVKYHPRELLGDFLLQENKKNVLVFPKAIPLELLYAFSCVPPKLIIGGHSTALLTARWIFSEAKIISTANLFEYYDQNIFETFKEKGINLVKSANDVETALKGVSKA